MEIVHYEEMLSGRSQLTGEHVGELQDSAAAGPHLKSKAFDGRERDGVVGAKAIDDMNGDAGLLQVGHDVAHNRGLSAAGGANNPCAYTASNKVQDSLDL
ncbi:hypothetical protein GCM10010052_13880 [Paenarthrobacter histidinolovorans]|nr:hypothetical protein GCM10010052_13880 [Paenarthrobacter histidinolovorans]